MPRCQHHELLASYGEDGIGSHDEPAGPQLEKRGESAKRRAVLRPVTRPENLQRLPKTKVRGETDALVACALAVPAWRLACRPAPRRISQISTLIRPVPTAAYCNCGDTSGVVPGTGWFGYRRPGLVFDGGQV